MRFFHKKLLQISEISFNDSNNKPINYGKFVCYMGNIEKETTSLSLLKSGVELIAELEEFKFEPTESERGDVLFWLIYITVNLPKFAEVVETDYELFLTETSNIIRVDQIDDQLEPIPFLDALSKMFRSQRVRSKEKKLKDFKQIYMTLEAIYIKLLDWNTSNISNYEYFKHLAKQNYIKLTDRHS